MDVNDDSDNNAAYEQKLAEVLSGNTLLEGSKTYSHCYCGHQFGSFAGQLGDGAAIYLGEVLASSSTADGYSHQELQLKGAGPTPFSRSSDGRKVLRSSIREFLCSEAMHFLNIPTTRAAACVTSDSRVARDPMYDGATILLSLLHFVRQYYTMILYFTLPYYHNGNPYPSFYSSYACPLSVGYCPYQGMSSRKDAQSYHALVQVFFDSGHLKYSSRVGIELGRLKVHYQHIYI